jgi:hypothetical protein
MKNILILCIALIAISCGPQKRLQKTYIGQPISTMEAEYGKAKTVFEKESGTDYIFEKVEHLKSTEISQHKLTLDPMITPKVTKISQYYVREENGIITKIKLVQEYKR